MGRRTDCPQYAEERGRAKYQCFGMIITKKMFLYDMDKINLINVRIWQ